MGLFRKLTSTVTLGAVDMRSDKERTAAYTKGTRNAVRNQTKVMKKQAKANEPAPPPIKDSWEQIKANWKAM